MNQDIDQSVKDPGHGLAEGDKAAPTGEPVTFTWSGNPWALFGLSLLNFVLTVLTLGIYYFWAKTEVRRRIWSSVRISGELLVYTGRGRELFLGFLIVLGLVFVPTIVVTMGLQIFFGPGSPVVVGFQVVLYIVFLFLFGLAVYRARRYRLSRTRWRGIRGALVPVSNVVPRHGRASGPVVYQAQQALRRHGYECPLDASPGGATGAALAKFQRDQGLDISGKLDEATIRALELRRPDLTRGGGMRYARSAFWTMLLIPLTLGWIVPWQTSFLYGRLTNDMAFGDRFFRYTGRSGPIYRRYVVFWIGVLLLFSGGGFIISQLVSTWVLRLGRTGGPRLDPVQSLIILALVLVGLLIYTILSAWYYARVYNHLFGHTHFDQARFRLRATAWSLVAMVVTNFLIVIFSLGILRPIAQARISRYFIDRLSVEGTVDFASIAQSQAALDATGEGLAEAFDIDAF